MRGVGIVCFALALGCNLQADALYDNTGETGVGSDFITAPPVVTTIGTFSQAGPLFDSFSTGGSATTLTGLELVLSNLSALFTTAPPAGVIDIGLYADSSSTPGSLITSLGTVNDSSIGDATLVSVLLTANPNLSADTRYWIGLSSDSTSPTTAASWVFEGSDAGAGVTGEFWHNSTGTFSNSLGPYLMQVSVPEPSSLIPGLLSLVMFGAAGLRKRLR